ncbi:matrixin family metalloprotease [Methylobacterium sp. HMF5984]
MSDYNTLGFKYGSNTTAGFAGGLLTWAIDSTVPAFFTSVLASALADWTSHANIHFQQVSPSASVTIKFTLSAIDGLYGTLGNGGSSYFNSSSGLNKAFSGQVTFDSGENWHVVGNSVVSDGSIDLFNVALHEIGHVIGLGHYNTSPAIMNSVLNTSLTDLTQSDIDGIQYLYGPSEVTGSWITLVNQSFYSSHYSDVAATGTDFATHYNSFGWHEGRDPDAYFTTNGYLAANADVARAGINPLAHYDQYGWKEGRDPAANFDNELYLANNADVKAAGIDPLAHYLQYGQAEGRQAYAAVGKAGDLGVHPGFDAEYYLLSNTDVAKAAIAAGGDSFAYAYNHYETYGWHEGRNPNTVFDTKGYLAAYGDVKAANIDPLAHYDNYGWHEGRDPSASFDTNAYEAANGDVKAAGIDPMLHYLQYGAVEGHSTFADGHFG